MTIKNIYCTNPNVDFWEFMSQADEAIASRNERIIRAQMEQWAQEEESCKEVSLE